MIVVGSFVKQPVPGQVKTRLAAKIGNEAACRLYAAMTDDVVFKLRGNGDRRFLCYSPGSAASREHFERVAAGDYQLWPQPDKSLGERMERFFIEQFEAGAKRVIIVGSDCLTMTADTVKIAFDRLEKTDCVIGPAIDGGYYLIGQRDRSRPIFQSVEWSTRSVFWQTALLICKCNSQHLLLQIERDIDTAFDLAWLRDDVDACEYPHTARVINEIFPKHA